MGKNQPAMARCDFVLKDNLTHVSMQCVVFT